MGTFVSAEESSKTGLTWTDPLSLPHDLMFSAKGFRNLVIIKNDNTELVIPFSDIVKALEKEE